MKRIFLAVLVVIFGFGVTLFIRLSNPNVDITQGNSNNLGVVGNESESKVVNNPRSSAITQEILSQHNKQSDCWVAYDGKVYDVTSFLPKHPGSAAAIAPHCGTYESFTNAFEGQHGRSKVSNLMKVGTLMGDFQIKGGI